MYSIEYTIYVAMHVVCVWEVGMTDMHGTTLPMCAKGTVTV